MDVKLSELPAYFARRNYTPRAMMQEFMRNSFRVINLNLWATFGPALNTIFKAIILYILTCWVFKYSEYREANKKCYYNW